MTTNANQSPREAADDWRAVPPGTLGKLQSSLASQQRRHRGWQWGSAVAALLVVGAVTWQLAGNRAAKAHALSCPECRELLEDYARKSLDATKSQEVHDHLERCPPCKKLYVGVQQKIEAAEDTALQMAAKSPANRVSTPSPSAPSRAKLAVIAAAP